MARGHSWPRKPLKQQDSGQDVARPSDASLTTPQYECLVLPNTRQRRCWRLHHSLAAGVLRPQ